MRGIDDVDLGIFAIAALGVIGIVGMAYVNTFENGDVTNISSFTLAIGGLIAALVRGKASS